MTTDDNTPLRLADAIPLAFPGGGMTVSGLRKEAKRGNLTLERIAGKDFVTLAAIREMRERCTIPARVTKIGTDRKGTRAPEDRRQGAPPAPEPDISPRDAFLARIEARKRKR